MIGSKQDALNIKEDLRRFLESQLKLTLSVEKTKVTHSSEAARYLGYDIRAVRDKSVKRDKNGALKRPWYGKVFLYVPHKKWENNLHELRVMKVNWDETGTAIFGGPCTETSCSTVRILKLSANIIPRFVSCTISIALRKMPVC